MVDTLRPYTYKTEDGNVLRIFRVAHHRIYVRVTSVENQKQVAIVLKRHIYLFEHWSAVFPEQRLS